jgi:hypothetical protein
MEAAMRRLSWDSMTDIERAHILEGYGVTSRHLKRWGDEPLARVTVGDVGIVGPADLIRRVYEAGLAVQPLPHQDGLSVSTFAEFKEFLIS